MKKEAMCGDAPPPPRPCAGGGAKGRRIHMANETAYMTPHLRVRKGLSEVISRLGVSLFIDQG